MMQQSGGDVNKFDLVLFSQALLIKTWPKKVQKKGHDGSDPWNDEIKPKALILVTNHDFLTRPQ